MLGGIRARLLGLVIATVVPFTALIGVGLWSQWTLDEAGALRSALGEARRVAMHVDDEVGNLENLLEGLRWAVSVDPADRSKNDDLLQRVKARLPSYISNILVVSLDGTNIGTSMTGPSEVRTYVGDRDYFKDILCGNPLAVGLPVRGRGTGQWISAIIRGIRNENGYLVAAIMLGIQLERFQEGLHMNELPLGSVVRIVAADGTMIAHSVDSATWVGRKIPLEGAIARHFSRADASEALVWDDGIERITGSAMSKRVAWHASVGMPVEVAFANIWLRLIWGAGAALIALLTVLGLAWAISSRIIRPLRELSSDASALASGQLSHRTAVRSDDEVGALAATFNDMASALEIRHRELNEAREAAAIEAGKRSQSEDLERQAKDTLAAVIDASPVAIACSNTKHQVVLWSRAAEQTFGFSAAEVLGQAPKIIPDEMREESRALFNRVVGGETVRDVEIKRRHKSGALIDIRLAATPMYEPDGSVWGIAWSFEDITGRKEAERQLNHLARFDQLTGLANRVALQEELAVLLDAKDPCPTSVALFDLDGFKDVNDTVGHSVGDQLLIQVAQRLSGIATDRGKVCRLGGDEFVAIIPNCGDPRLVDETVNAMLRELTEPFQIGEHVLHIGGSAGIAMAPIDGTTVDELIANADLALYKVKSEGGRSSRFFVPTFRAQAQMRHGLQFELRRAFANEEFELYFQPQVRLIDNTVVGAEALLRWRHPTQGLVAPGAFIEALSNSAIAPDVGRWIVEKACGVAASLRRNGLALPRIAINLFPCQCTANSPKEFAEALQRTGLPADVLELEITETVALKHDEAIVPLREIHAKGIQLAFDDFGTGYASLSYLARYPVSRIKIDRSFVANVTLNGHDAAIVRSLIAMAHSLGLTIIAEGIETADQAAFLIKENCEEAQGYLYAKPLPEAEFEAYLRTRQIAERPYVSGKPLFRAGAYAKGRKPAGRRRLPAPTM
jgi:diguanylate cyclase (GGDEF)-like protein/PAS domain S-box-containing protein